MTSGNDKKGPPPPRRPAPVGAPQRPAGPTTGGSAARPAPRPGVAPPARPAAPAPRPAPRPMEAEADEKTSAISLADFGLGEDEATVSVDSAAIKARAAAKAVIDDGEERTQAFNVADLPPDDEPKRAPQKTLLGHPAPKPGAAVRGGAAPVKRADTLAIAPPSRPRPQFSGAAAGPAADDEKTSAISLDDIGRIDAAPARPAPSFGGKASPPPQEERTMAMSLDDVDKIDMRPTPQRGGAKKPAQLEQDEKTQAVSLDDIDRIDAAPKRASARIPSRAELDAMQEEKTTAMSLDDVDKIDANLAKRKAEAQVPAGKVPARANKAAAAMSSLSASSASADGFLGDIGYLFKADALAAKGLAVDDSKKSAGLRNLIISGGIVAALMLAIGIIW